MFVTFTADFRCLYPKGLVAVKLSYLCQADQQSTMSVETTVMVQATTGTTTAEQSVYVAFSKVLTISQISVLIAICKANLQLCHHPDSEETQSSAEPPPKPIATISLSAAKLLEED